MNSIELKKSFMQACGQPVRETPGEPTVEERKLNLALILEELTELSDAYGMRATFNMMMAEKAGVYAAMGLDCGEEVPYVEYGPEMDTFLYEPVQTLDALCDIRVVADGPILSSGLQGMWEDAMNEVSRSNLSKICIDGIEVEETIYQYSKQGVEAEAFTMTTHSDGSPHHRVIRRTSDGKVLKSVLYSPADLESVYRKHVPEASDAK